MVVMILMVVCGTILLVLSARSFRQKGPLLMTLYWVATPAERERMKSKENYRFVGYVFLLCAAIVFIVGFNALLHLPWLNALNMMLILGTLTYAVVMGFRGVTRGTM